jgi:membrane protein
LYPPPGGYKRDVETAHILTDAIHGWQRHKDGRLAAALAYYAVFSLAPLLLIVVSLVGIIFGRSNAQQQVHAQLRQVIGEDAARFVDALIAGTTHAGGSGHLALYIGIGLAGISAISIFLALQDALDEVWEVPSESKGGFFKMVVLRLHSLIIVFALALVAVVALIGADVVAAFARFATGSLPPAPVMEGVSIAINVASLTLFLAVVYRVLPMHEVAWRSAWIGAAATAIVLLLGEVALSIYFRRMHPGSSYGAAGALVVLLLWIYYSAQLLLFGAELTRAIEESRSPERARAATLRPSKAS